MIPHVCPAPARRHAVRFGCGLAALASLLIGYPGSASAQMSAEEQLKTLRVPAGFDVALFASEPMITNPAAIDIDTHGRVWVAEIQWYRSKAKQPAADKIKVLEDTDGDGRADKMTVFADGIFAPMSICVAGDKVYVATSPDLWVYEDRDGDLRADGPPTKLLTGFGGFNHDHGAHSLVLGPDHKWWMAHGDTGFDVKGTDGSHIKFRWGAMLRGELDGSKLETVAVNFRNPYELCVSSFGECYFSDNDNDGNESVRAGWVLEGGDYGWFGGPPGPKGHVPAEVPFSRHWHFRGHIPGHVPATLVTGFGSPCGIFFYESDAFGPMLKNVPLHCDAGPREVRRYPHQIAGYGMTATSENIVTSDGDKYFRPDDICAAPDGSLYIADWYDGGVGGHAYNDPDRGRIFRLTPSGKKLTRADKPGPYTTISDAIDALKSPNLATQFLARERLLADGARSVPALEKLLNDPEPNYRARSLWLLDRIGGPARDRVRDQLGDSDSSIRALAVRILRRHGSQFADPILALASDPSPEVRREVLLAVRELDSERALECLVQAARSYDGSDRYQLELIHIAAGNHKQKLYTRLAESNAWSIEKLPLMAVLDPTAARQFLVRKLSESATNERDGKKLLDMALVAQSPEIGRAVIGLLANPKAAPALRRHALETLDVGLATGWKSLAADAPLGEALRPLINDPVHAPRVLDLATRHAITPLGASAADLATSPDAPVALRTRGVQAIAQLKPSGHTDVLTRLLADPQPDVRRAALNALVDMQDIHTLRSVLTGNAHPVEVRVQTVERLMAAGGGALALLRMVEAKTLPESIQKEAFARAAAHPDANVRVLFENYIPADQRPKRLGEAIQPNEILALQGNAKRGEQIFFQSTAAQCKNCHTVRGQGAAIGPDLSLIGKKYERATLLETILDPSKAIAPEYYTYLLETRRGQVFAGFLVEKNDRQVVLKDSKGDLIRVPARDVVELMRSDKSQMPDLVLRDVTAQDAADLLAYLVTLDQPTPAP